MSPIQLLLQNLFYDFMNLAFVFDNVDEEYIKRPQSWNPKSVLVFGFYNGIVPIIISVINFLVLGYGFNLFNEIAMTNDNVHLHYIQQFQSAFFLESLTTHVLLVLIYRTDQMALVKSRPSVTLSLVLFFFLGLGFVLIYTPTLNEVFGYQPMENDF
jgi:Mg2+-importing ATPase